MKQYKCVSITILLLITLGSIYAGTTGKIRGIVTDAANGEPLAGVNIIIKRTFLGAATEVNGEYIILQIPPGEYTVETNLIGYKTAIATGVKVEIDRTVSINFELIESILEGEAVIVEAPRDLIGTDVSASISAITQENMVTTPFYSRVEDVIGMQAGVTGNIIEGEIKIREGDAFETDILVDGYSTSDPKFNRPVFTISPGTVQEINVIRGGYNAEYGESRSGVVNIVTTDPSHDFHVNIDYQLEFPSKRHGGRDYYDPKTMWQYRLYDGPNADSASYLVRYEGITNDTIRWEGWAAYADRLLNDANPDNDLTAEEARELWRWRHRPVEYGTEFGHNIDISMSGGTELLPWDVHYLAGFKYENRPYNLPQTKDSYTEAAFTLKLVNKLGLNTRLTFTALHSHAASVTQGSSSSHWSTEDRLSYGGGSGERFYFFRHPLNDRFSTLLGLKLLHIFSSKRFIEADISYFGTSWDVRTGPASPADEGRNFHGRLYYDPQSGWIPREQGVDDKVSGFRMYGGGTTWDDSYGRKYAMSAALVDQFHPAHELKAGFDFSYNEVVENRIKWDNDDSTQTFIYEFNVPPIKFSAYIQDKIEFEGMIANIGLRWDYYAVNGTRSNIHRVLDYPSNSAALAAYLNGEFPSERPSGTSYLSPRLGVSFPLTVNSKVYFNFGHFVQIPNNEVLFSTQLNLSPNEERIQLMGNPFLTFMKSINYEIGYDQNVLDYFQFHIGAFYKDYSNSQSGMVYAHADQSLVTEWFAQREYREVRGIDIEIRRAVGRFFTGFFNFNITQKSVSDLSVPGISQIPIITDTPSIGVNGELKGVPRPIVEEITPYGRGVITLSAPENWGPRISNYPILHKTRLSFGLFYSGPQLVNHPDGTFREQHPDVKFYTIPYFSSNLRITRNFNVWANTQFELYLDISNLLVSNYRNIGGKDYYNDLWRNGKTDKVGSEDVSDKRILRTESDNLYRGNYSTYVLGMRLIL
jgi:hypothetical protein